MRRITLGHNNGDTPAMGLRCLRKQGGRAPRRAARGVIGPPLSPWTLDVSTTSRRGDYSYHSVALRTVHRVHVKIFAVRFSWQTRGRRVSLKRPNQNFGPKPCTVPSRNTIEIFSKRRQDFPIGIYTKTQSTSRTMGDGRRELSRASQLRPTQKGLACKEG